MRPDTRWLLAGALVLATGCGTTVSGVGSSSGAASVNGGLSVPSGAAAPGASQAGTGLPPAPSAAPGQATGAGVRATTAGGTTIGTSSSSGGAGPGLPSSGRGYDAGHVYLGFPTNNDVNSAAPSGIGATNFGDQPTIIKSVVADINRRGGILGRTVVPVFHDIPTANLQSDPSGQAQATCTALTQDAHVVAVVNIVASIDLPTFYSCLAKADTPLISAGFVPADDQMFSGYAPYLYKLTAASFTRLTPLWLSRLTAMGYFHGWDTTNGAPASAPAKVGLLYPSVQPQQRIFADIKRRLSASGITVAREYQYDISSLDHESASMSNAVLQMRNAGVTHILSSEADVLLFMTAADSQHYRPRYALTSYHAAAAQLQGTVPASQLVGSMGIGWLPASDVDAAHNPGPVSSGETSCRRLMHNAGQDTSSAGVATVAFAVCDAVRLIAAGINTSKNPGSAGLHTGLSAIGPAFAAALTWRNGLVSTRYDMPGGVRDFTYTNGAFSYRSKSLYRL
jgi:ABC-type branched-subunit amino acid transport system substrate-binding protein